MMDHAHITAGELLVALGVAAAYATLGVIVFLVAFKIMQKMMPFSLRKEIEEDQNVALGVLMGAVILGLAIIIGAAVG
jgi:putative membrane protein